MLSRYVLRRLCLRPCDDCHPSDGRTRSRADVIDVRDAGERESNDEWLAIRAFPGRSVASVRAALCVRSLFNAAVCGLRAGSRDETNADSSAVIFQPLCGDMLLASTSWVAARVRLPPPEYVHPALPRISPQGLHTTGLAYPYPRPLLPNSTIPIAAHDLS